MKFRQIIFSAFLLFLPILSFSGELTGKIVQVHDGDTVLLQNEDTYTKIRLYGIDCPELKQNLGEEARRFTAEHCLDKDVKVSTGKNKDRYKREIGTIYIDGKNINIELLKNGLAWHYKQYSKDKEYAEAEQKAISQKLGIWQKENSQAPWEFRKTKKKLLGHIK